MTYVSFFCWLFRLKNILMKMEKTLNNIPSCFWIELKRDLRSSPLSFVHLCIYFCQQKKQQKIIKWLKFRKPFLYSLKFWLGFQNLLRNKEPSWVGLKVNKGLRKNKVFRGYKFSCRLNVVVGLGRCLLRLVNAS